jgi:hypothetical protein
MKKDFFNLLMVDNIFIIIFFIALSLKANAQSNLAIYSSTGMEYGKASAVDADNNYIKASLFQNTINVNPNGITNLTSPSLPTQMALTKYNAQGALVWANHIGGLTTSEGPHGVDTDPNNNIYVTGYFGSTTQTNQKKHPRNQRRESNARHGFSNNLRSRNKSFKTSIPQKHRSISS